MLNPPRRHGESGINGDRCDILNFGPPTRFNNISAGKDAAMTREASYPAIIVVAFNRTESLNRLFKSIDQANYEGFNNIPLVISIDQGGPNDVLQVSNNFQWNRGSKRIIQHKNNLGLRNHIISCGDLVNEYGAVIVLEDDLFVSPAFYDYAVQAMRYFDMDESISGISLYSYDFNEYANMRFFPIEDGYDNYFIQSPSSCGQLWTKKQWHGFKTWYEDNNEQGVSLEDPIPNAVARWPENSWKKYFIKYMVLERKYFVYPKTSLSTNLGDIGTHTIKVCDSTQVSLSIGKRKINFISQDMSLSIYDCHYEIEPRCLIRLNPRLKEVDFVCDLYGTRDIKKTNSSHLISIRESNRPIEAYALNLLPQELNIVYEQAGNFFHLAKVNSFKEINPHKRIQQIKRLGKDIGLREYGKIFSLGLLERFLEIGKRS
jgi:hypothetical protein